MLKQRSDKRAEKREEERDPGDKAGIYSFINDETGGLAVFLVSEAAEDSDGGGGSVVDGKITMNPGGSFFVLESCGPDCGVLTQFEKRPKVYVVVLSALIFTHGKALRFISDKERIPPILVNYLGFCNNHRVSQNMSSFPKASRRSLAPKAPSKAEESGSSRALIIEGPENCRDALDWTLCGYLFNTGQCALMVPLALLGVWIPCLGTCGPCELPK